MFLAFTAIFTRALSAEITFNFYPDEATFSRLQGRALVSYTE
jgi:hypothetical protein